MNSTAYTKQFFTAAMINGKKAGQSVLKNTTVLNTRLIETTIGSEIKDTEQKFIYLYDLKKNWIFHIQLINVSKEENPKLTYPAITRKEGIGPSQYGIKSILGDKFADIEEKYDLSAIGEGFSDEGEDEGEQDDELGGEEAGGEDENNF